MIRPCLLVVPAALLMLTMSARAQISKPTETELNAVPPQFNDLVHGRSDKINSDAARRAGGGPPPGPPPAQRIHNPSRDPRDFSGQWAGAGMAGPPGAGLNGASNGPPRGRASRGGPPAGFPSAGNDDPRPGTIVATSIDGNRLCEPSLSVNIGGAVIYQTARQLTVVGNDELRARRYYLDGKPDGPTTPSYAGRSTAHWDGNTLVIDTRDLKGVITPLGFDVEIGVRKLKLANPTLEVTTRFHKSADGDTLLIDQTWRDSAARQPPYHRLVTLHYVKAQPGLDNECAIEGNVFGPAYGKAAR